jgi:Bacterial Ig-like domain (group 2)
MRVRAPWILPTVLLCFAGCGTEPVVARSTELLAGSQQTGALGAPLAESLSVRVVASDGKPFKGAQVSWSIVTGGGSLSPATSTTSPDGIARTLWTLGTRLDATYVARATAAGLSPVTFTATPTLPPSAAIEKAAGDAQQQMVDNALTDSLVATVKLADGRAVQGATVSWAAGANAGSVSPASAVTNSDGVAKASWRLGTLAGPVTATASVSGLASATFGATATPGPVDTVTIDAQTKVLVGSTAQLTARLADRYGNVITGKTVAWSSNSAQVASVSASGVVTGVRAGRTTVVATTEGKSASGLVGVVAPLGFGTPIIDGVLASGEWANATSFPIDVVLPEGGTTPGTLYVMNDASSLYLAVRYARSVEDQGKGVDFEFDNNASALFGLPTIEEGDDIVLLNAGSQLVDDYRTYRPPCPTQIVCGLSDTDDGGTVDGSATYAHDGTSHVFEIAHPLRSGDTAHDFSLSAGQELGLQVDIVIIAAGGEYPRNFAETRWPNGGYVYVRIGSPR